jgi:hypothetical protein
LVSFSDFPRTDPFDSKLKKIEKDGKERKEETNNNNNNKKKKKEILSRRENPNKLGFLIH